MNGTQGRVEKFSASCFGDPAQSVPVAGYVLFYAAHGKVLPARFRVNQDLRICNFALTEVLTNDRHFEQEGFRALFRA